MSGFIVLNRSGSAEGLPELEAPLARVEDRLGALTDALKADDPAALETAAIAGVVQRDAMGSLREVITGNLTVMDRPEQFCFGLLREFDVPQLQALVAPRPGTGITIRPSL